MRQSCYGERRTTAPKSTKSSFQSKASERINRLTRASLTNIDEAGNFFKSANSDERLLRRKYSLPTQTSSDFSSKLQLSKVRSSSQNVLSSEAQSDENISRTPSRSANKKRVRFGSTGIEREGSSSRHIETSLDSPRTSLLSSHDGMSSRSGQQPTDGLKLGSMLSYYNANLLAENLRRSSKGFSHNANSLPKAFRLRNSLAQSTGLEDEMNRWRRLHYTRSMNARLKAVRPLGRRHPVNVTLRDVMDANARMRKETALRSEQFTPENAWQMLNCRYLRLTRSNIEHLENVCEEAGYDISTHPHVSESQWVNVFKNT
ncbi:uncharacterized protein LOC143471742 isoform X2 [Clavelina lepadiformis]|uniref:uncharacterized protein LOC143471742 isoform X2 n=1 Tax=Clavelina lepadiformis TaxID=159417 RepID=UPI00404198DB